MDWKQVIMASLLLLVMVAFIGCQQATMHESWKGPAVQNACEPQMGTGYSLGHMEFVPVGFWKWKDVNGQEHHEPVYIMRDMRDGKAGVK